MAELRWTLEALDWLEDIQRYIAQDNPQAMANVIDEIVQKAGVLTAFPICAATTWIRLKFWVCSTTLLISTGTFHNENQ